MAPFQSSLKLERNIVATPTPEGVAYCTGWGFALCVSKLVIYRQLHAETTTNSLNTVHIQVGDSLFHYRGG